MRDGAILTSQAPPMNWCLLDSPAKTASLTANPNDADESLAEIRIKRFGPNRPAVDMEGNGKFNL